MVAVAGDGARLGGEASVEGHRALEPAGERRQSLGRTEPDRLHDVAADRARQRVHGLPEFGEERGRQVEAGQTLRHHEGRLKETLDERAAEPEGGPQRVPEPGRVVARRDPLHDLRATDHVPAPGREPPAEILDERTHDGVHPMVGRFRGLDEFAVAVVHEHDGRGRDGAHGARDVAALRGGERAARRVAARALHEDYVHAGGAGRAQRFRVHGAVAQRNFVVAHAAPHERVRRVDDRIPQRVVRRSRRREQPAALRKARVERGDDRVRSADERQSRERTFGTEDPREQRFVTRARGVVVPVTERAREIALRDALVDERGEHAGVRERTHARVCREIHARYGATRGRGDARIDREPLEEYLERIRVHAALSAPMLSRARSERS